MRGSARRILIMMQHITMHGQANGRCLENNHDAGHRGVCSCPGERGGAVGFGVLVLTEAQRTRRWTARPGRVQELYATYVSELQLDLYTYAFYALTQAGHAAAGLASNPRSAARCSLRSKRRNFCNLFAWEKAYFISISHASNSLACYNVCCCMLLCLYNATDAPLT